MRPSMQANVFDGPIPGANFTSDERNWPWHRAPDISDTDEALEFIAYEMTDTPKGFRYMNMIESGVTIATITDIIVTLGIGNGKWTPDFALLLAGPTARFLEVMAKSYDIDYDLGIEEINTEPTAAFYDEMRGISQQFEEGLAANTEDNEETADDAGLMTPSTDEEQQMMLGYSADEEPAQDEEEV